MNCDFCFMDHVFILKLPVTIKLDEQEAKTLKWGKYGHICVMCIESEAAIFEQEQAKKSEQ